MERTFNYLSFTYPKTSIHILPRLNKTTRRVDNRPIIIIFKAIMLGIRPAPGLI